MMNFQMPYRCVGQSLGKSLAPALISGLLGSQACQPCTCAGRGEGIEHMDLHFRCPWAWTVNFQVHCARPRPYKNSVLASSGRFYGPGSGFLERRATSHARELGSGEFYAITTEAPVSSSLRKLKGVLFVEPTHAIGLNMLLDSIFNHQMNVDIH